MNHGIAIDKEGNMDTLKECIKLLKYDIQKKMMIVSLLLFSFMTVLYTFLFFNNQQQMGAHYWLPFMAIFPLQGLYNVMFSKYVISAPKFRKILIKGTTILHTTFTVVAYIIAIGGECLIAREIGFDLNIKMIVMTFLMVDLTTIIYIQIYYRSVFWGIVSIVPMCVCLIAATQFRDFVTKLQFDDSIMIVVGFVGIALISAISYGVGCLLYKIPFSDAVIKRMLSKTK